MCAWLAAPAVTLWLLRVMFVHSIIASCLLLCVFHWYVFQLMVVQFLPAGKILGREGTSPTDVVVVRQGSVKVTGSNMPGAV